MPVYRQQWNGRRKRRHNPELNKRTIILLTAGGLLVLFGTIGLIVSAVQKRDSQRTDEEMRALYHAEEPAVSPAPVAENTPESTAQSIETPMQAASETPATGAPMQADAETSAFGAPLETETPVPTPVPRLEAQAYPDNPGRSINARFQALRKENRDIVGWLTIGSMVDEAVVQRDNEFYMDHNVKKEADVSGAIFLDEAVSLETRPYALILYGHNMKNGSRFGSLRNFENRSFYRKYPFISFDTLYEEGKYVIFSAGIVSTEESDPHYLDFFALNSDRVDERRQAIETLESVSVYSKAIDVRVDDQVLLLVTCVERDADRRVIAARRIRDGEDQKTLKELAEKSRKN